MLQPDESNMHIPVSPSSTSVTSKSSYEVHDVPASESTQLDVIYRRVRKPEIKSDYMPSRFTHLPNTWEFSEWGEMELLTLSEEDMTAGYDDVKAIKDAKVLGQFTASALAGNIVLGSVFYALPQVFAVGGI
jgi:hypothetical protein